MSTIDDVIAKRHAELLKRSNTLTVSEIVRQRMETASVDVRADSAPVTPRADKRSQRMKQTNAPRSVPPIGNHRRGRGR